MLNPLIIDSRAVRFRAMADGGALDVFVVGGGISGAMLHDVLCRRGYRVAMVDKGDFASGTSQASGMLVWGGLLYLKKLDVATVAGLCKARKAMMKKCARQIRPLDMHYLVGGTHAATKAFVWAALQFYWLLGGCELDRPRFKTGPSGDALIYQEGMLSESDSRFVIDQISAHDSEHSIALNHCRVVTASRDSSHGLWRIGLNDELTGTEHQVTAKVLINAAGVWADELNRLARLESRYKHVFSKGVYLAFPRGDSVEARIYPMLGRNDVLTHVPWGPVSMWGPTETGIHNMEAGFSADRDDIRFLLDQARRQLHGQHRAEDVVSIRCGIRPLAVPRNYNRDQYPLSLSRRHQVEIHQEMMAMTIYGGKFTSGMAVAEHTANLLKRWIPPSRPSPPTRHDAPETRTHHGLGQAFVTPEWARDRESCATLEDYLRRRTNIAQWMPRMGLGQQNEQRDDLLETANAFADGPISAEAMVCAYEQRVRKLYDPLLSA
jgi:glycerol-3-phosphate dehydrogenase